jgi:hypothetical protein
MHFAHWVIACTLDSFSVVVVQHGRTEHGVSFTTAGAIRLLKKQYLHYVLAPEQPAPADLLAAMVQQASRHRRGHMQEQAAGDGSALFSFSKGMAFVPRHVVNAQVGPSGLGGTLQDIWVYVLHVVGRSSEREDVTSYAGSIDPPAIPCLAFRVTWPHTEIASDSGEHCRCLANCV